MESHKGLNHRSIVSFWWIEFGDLGQAAEYLVVRLACFFELTVDLGTVMSGSFILAQHDVVYVLTSPML